VVSVLFGVKRDFKNVLCASLNSATEINSFIHSSRCPQCGNKDLQAVKFESGKKGSVLYVSCLKCGTRLEFNRSGMKIEFYGSPIKEGEEPVKLKASPVNKIKVEG